MKKALRETQTLRALAVVRFGHHRPARRGPYAGGGATPCMPTKFEADRSFRSKVIRGSRNFDIGSRDPGRAHFGVVLFSMSECVVRLCTKFETDWSIRSKVIMGPEIMKLGHVTPATPTYGSFCGPCAGRLRPVCLYQI